MRRLGSAAFFVDELQMNFGDLHVLQAAAACLLQGLSTSVTVSGCARLAQATAGLLVSDLRIRVNPLLYIFRFYPRGRVTLRLSKRRQPFVSSVPSKAVPGTAAVPGRALGRVPRPRSGSLAAGH